MNSIKTLLQLMFGYSLMACAGRGKYKYQKVQQFKTFWTLRDAMHWMSLYGTDSSVIICRWNKPVCGRRAVRGVY